MLLNTLKQANGEHQASPPAISTVNRRPKRGPLNFNELFGPLRFPTGSKPEIGAGWDLG
jgi:hypothetical protein